MSTKHLSNRIDALSGMDLDALRKEFTSVLGRPTNSKDKESMIQQIGKRLLLGGKAPAAAPSDGAAPATQKAKTKAAREPDTTNGAKPSPFTADPRLPAPGSTIKVTHKKKDYECKFLGADGYEYAGERFRSLSAIASKILGGVAVNGFLWWGLIKRPAADAKPAAAPAKEPAKAKRAKGKKPARKAAKPTAKKS
jgi:hypothetical protein